MVLTLEEIKSRLENDQIEPSLKLKLAVDAYRIHLKHLFDPLSCVATGRIDPLPHQIESFVKMMNMLRPHGDTDGRIRVLLADDVGLGKTIMIGMVLKELLLSSRIKKVLIVCPAGLQIQWQEELLYKFGESFEIIRGKVGLDNPFKHVNKCITSMDYAKNPEKLELLKDTHWDLVIIDEAHKLKYGNLRFALGEVLSENSSNLILATATPHDGKLENFLNILGLLDQNLQLTEDRYELIRYLDPIMIRRMKNEITNFKGQNIFPHREDPYTIDIDFNHEEEEFYDAMGAYVNKYYRKAEERNKTSAVLALYILHRMVSSSIYAGLQALKNRKNRLWEPFLETKDESIYFEHPEDLDAKTREEDDDIIIGSTASIGDELKEELEELEELISMGQNLVDSNEDSKSLKLIEGLKELRRTRPEDKIILFTEFKPTLFNLKRILEEEGFSVVEIHGSMDIKERELQRDNFENFANILIGTDAISEGLNLQFANIVVNYELPWNPNRLEQRIGRAYRYGQEKPVFIYNYKTGFAIDNHVLEKLVEKLEEIRLAFGDRTVDVIGSLISEKEMMEIFKIARTVGDTDASDRVQGLIEEKLLLIDNIEHYMIKNRFDLTEVLRATRSIESGVVKFDVERFLLSYLSNRENGSYDPIGKNTHILYLNEVDISADPKCTENIPPYKNKVYDFQGTFDKDAQRKYEYVALGNPALSMALEKSMNFEGISLLKGEENGLLLSYILRFFDAQDQEVYAEPILIFMNEKEAKVIDPLQIWDYDTLEEDYIPQEFMDFLDTVNFTEIKREIDPQIQDLKKFAQNKHEKDLELDLKRVNADYECKIAIEERNIEKAKEKGQRFLIPGHAENVSSLRAEHLRIVSELESSRNIRWELCGPLSSGIVIKPEKASGVNDMDIEKLKKEVEKAGVDYIIKKEKEWGRETVYNSLDKEEFRGYDLLTISDSEKRMIEAKSFKTEGNIQISSNEWRVASENPDNYHLYVVKNALDDPELTKIRDPYNNLSEVAKTIHFDDYKVVIDPSGLDDAIKSTKTKLIVPEPAKEESSSDIMDQLMSSDFVNWIENLPYPLSSILWKYYAERNTSKQVKILFNYFEALCEFHGTIIVSLTAEALKNDRNILEDPNILEDRVEWIIQTSFGKWYTFGGRIAKKIRFLSSSGSKNHRLLFEKFLDITGQSREFIDLMTNKQLYNLFNDVKDYRNRHKGHGGDSSEEIEKEVLQYLEKQLYRTWRTISNIYLDNILIMPQEGTRLEDHYQYDVRKIIGTRTPFITMKLQTDNSLKTKTLYLINKDKLKPLQILPFFKILESSKTSEEACYFYREVDGSTVRWISYHYGIDPELYLPLERDIKKAIEILLPS
ncbi:DUF3883 domain-containing protein [Methanobacterium alkalithermotolerans]|uniref:DUF3883 domain-containing protein n=1 Tax=Methanobacterium alkalithermotolerans TaxID=2731220 RepID=A0A8T8K1U6_9EURY|nr:helicase-related protein [Methanobacterium alkalithermotolerans]QUH22358.1 DUF3883 domain-containing protein [Methanobacterium alkalithermotolerans]